jgi:endonuclease/exonuclease/phosphatase family metal-dependent hydrolase
MSDAGLADSHRGHGFESSWPTWSPLLRAPIDNCLVSAGLAVTKRTRGPALGSDHYPLLVELAATSEARAPATSRAVGTGHGA